VPAFAKVAAFALAATLLNAAAREFQVNGVVVPAAAGVAVILSSADSPFIARMVTHPDGRFRFRNVAPGEYAVWVSVPDVGEVLQTVAVGPSFAAPDGRIAITIPLSAAQAVPSIAPSRHSVSVRELTIPDPARKEYAEAVKLLGVNDARGATRRLEKAVSLAPQFWAAWNDLGTIAYRSGRYSEAETFFQKAHEQAPEAFDPVSNLGGVLLNLGRYQEALEYNTSAVRQRPRDVLANSQTGLNYFLLNRLDKALTFLKEAKRLDPFHFTHPQRFLAEIYLRLSNRAAAAAELEDFVTRHPDGPEAASARRQLAELHESRAGAQTSLVGR
jgi:predicted Zn-dependent protease